VVLSTFETGETEWHQIPVTLPTGEIVDRLNAADPSLVLGFPSALYSLVHEAREGRLSIRPRRIMSVAEPLFPEIRSALEGMWDVPVVNGWGMTEAAFNVGCGQSPGIHLSEDLFIIEPVDTTGRPVPVGTRSDKIFVTNLVNHAMPLIRYEVTDQLTLTAADCPCGSVHQLIEDPLGRLDDCFHYDGITVNAHVFRSPLGRCRHIVEYQVRQTPEGAAVAARSVGPVDIPGLEAEIAGQLSGLGVPSPKVVVTPVDHLERQYSGKLKRFVPL
jgi:phenylacetate-coenzyme A ligase PaaK-like adenylate-forming protein